MKKELLQKILSDTRKFIKQNNFKEASVYLKEVHPGDIAYLIDKLEVDGKRKIFKLLTSEVAADVIHDVNEDSRRQLLQQINIKRLVSIIETMVSDDATDVISALPDHLKTSVLENIPDEDARDVKMLLKYPEETAGGIMQCELISVSEKMTVKEAIGAIRVASDDIGDIHNLFIVDDRKKPIGILTLRKLILAKSDTTVSSIMEEIPITIYVRQDQEEVASYFQKYDEVSLPVVDEQEQLVGRIMVDDIMDVLEQEASEDILKMVGTDEEELLFSTSILKVAKMRLPWMLVSLLGGIFSGFLIWQFEKTFESLLLLVSFIPVIMGMGGNIGTQTSSITVRGLATGRIHLSFVREHIKREILVGLTMGGICGTIAGFIASFWGAGIYLGLIVGVSMFFAISVAALMGTLVPLIFKRYEIDPALASGPFVTTANDITGLLIYFLLANLLLKFM